MDCDKELNTAGSKFLLSLLNLTRAFTNELSPVLWKFVSPIAAIFPMKSAENRFDNSLKTFVSIPLLSLLSLAKELTRGAIFIFFVSTFVNP